VIMITPVNSGKRKRQFPRARISLLLVMNIMEELRVISAAYCCSSAVGSGMGENIARRSALIFTAGEWEVERGRSALYVVVVLDDTMY
jgi:hypothetical protein